MGYLLFSKTSSAGKSQLSHSGPLIRKLLESFPSELTVHHRRALLTLEYDLATWRCFDFHCRKALVPFCRFSSRGAAQKGDSVVSSTKLFFQFDEASG